MKFCPFISLNLYPSSYKLMKMNRKSSIQHACYWCRHIGINIYKFLMSLSKNKVLILLNFIIPYYLGDLFNWIKTKIIFSLCQYWLLENVLPVVGQSKEMNQEEENLHICFSILLCSPKLVLHFLIWQPLFIVQCQTKMIPPFCIFPWPSR